MTKSQDDIFGWRFSIPAPGERNPEVKFNWVVGVADELEAYKALNNGNQSMPMHPPPQSFTVAEASRMGLNRGEVRLEGPS